MTSLRLRLRLFTLIILLIVLLESCSSEDPQIGQLLGNSNVEIGSTTPNNWFFSTAQGKYNVTWTDKESFSPNKSLQISIQSPESTDFAFWGQTINTNLPTGNSVTLKVKIKGNLTGTGISIAIRGDDTVQAAGTGEQFVTTQGTSPISGTFDWTDYSIKLDNVDPGTQSLTVYLVFLPNTTGEVYFDDIILTN